MKKKKLTESERRIDTLGEDLEELPYIAENFNNSFGFGDTMSTIEYGTRYVILAMAPEPLIKADIVLVFDSGKLIEVDDWRLDERENTMATERTNHYSENDDENVFHIGGGVPE
jgi:hypothetical protein